MLDVTRITRNKIELKKENMELGRVRLVGRSRLATDV
jgi:hypothetical protein